MMNQVFFWGEEKPPDSLQRSLPRDYRLQALPAGEEGLRDLTQRGGGLLVCPPLDPSRRRLLQQHLEQSAVLVLEADPHLEHPRLAGRQNGYRHLLVPPQSMPGCLAGLLLLWESGPPAGEEQCPEDSHRSELAEYLSRILGVASTFRVAGQSEQVFAQVSRQLVEHFPFNRAMLFLWREGRLVLQELSWPEGDQHTLRRVLAENPPVLDPQSAEYQNLSLGMALPLDLEQSDFFPPAVRRLLHPVREVALAPLFTDQDFLGVVEADLAQSPQQSLDQGHLAILEAYLTLVGTLIFNTWLFAELEENNRALELKVKELTVVNEMTRLLNQDLVPEKLAHLLLAAVARILKADAGFLFIYDQDSRTLRLFGDYGLEGKLVRSWRKLSVAEEALAPPVEARGLLPGLEGPSLVHVLRSRGQVTGLWGLSRRPGGDPFDQGDEQVLSTADDHVTVAMNSLRLRHLASTDPLTGLFTRRHFREALEHDLASARQRGQPLALLMVDADHFKRVNDTYGHPAGDAVLVHLARCLNQCTRNSDVCARIGGEEFAVILPRCDGKAGWEVAEKIRKTVAAQPAVYQDQKISYTISLGVAVQESGQTVEQEELIRLADAALYRSKNHGRNRSTLLKAG